VGNENLPAGIYTIPRYSYFSVNGIVYSFIKDTTFNKITGQVEDLTTLSSENLLYQGPLVEYPAQGATGEVFETFTVSVKDNITNNPLNIDQDSFGVYVKDVNTGLYTEFNLTNSLFLESSTSPSYELRLNENGYYEIKFGNNIFGKKLNAGDLVYIYYLQSNGAAGVISANQLNGNTLSFYSTPQFNQIALDVLNTSLNYLNVSEASNISFTNDLASSPPNQPESVDEIRNNSPKTFFSQNRLITEQDFVTFVNKTFSNIVIDTKVVNNNTYIDTFIKYFYNLGITRPNDDPRYIFNEVNFSHAGQTNNIYIFNTPRIKNVDENNRQYFLQNSQKNVILSSMTNYKALNMELIPQDPIYTAFTLGLVAPNETLNEDIYKTTFLVVKKTPDVRVDINAIKNNINTIFQNYFKPENCKLGQLISINDLVTQILSVNGVDTFLLRRVLANGTTITSNGLSLLVFNPNYSTVDIDIISSNLQLPYFKFPFLYNKSILNNIIVE